MTVGMVGRPRQDQCSRGHGPEHYRRGPSGRAVCAVCRGYRGMGAGLRDRDRASSIVTAIDSGSTLAAVGERLGLTRERVRQIYRQSTGHGVPPFAPRPPRRCILCHGELGGGHARSDEHQDAIARRREARFWGMVDVSADACWPWTGAINPSTGYAHVRAFGEWNGHRAAYVLAKGPIGVGLVIDHLCRNEACVNPAHLEAVTHRENVRRGLNHALRRWHRDVREPRPRPTRVRCGHGHDLTDPENVRHTADGRLCRPCASRRTSEYRERRRACLPEAAA